MKPRSLDELRQLDPSQISLLFHAGTTPDLRHFSGAVDGVVLTRGVISALRVWRGKQFHSQSGSVDQVSGVNRLGLGPVELRRFKFTGCIAPSIFSPRNVLFLDHNKDGNPSWVRAYHDEVVDIGEGLFLGRSHIKKHGRLIFVGYFALQLPGK